VGWVVLQSQGRSLQRPDKAQRLALRAEVRSEPKTDLRAAMSLGCEINARASPTRSGVSPVCRGKLVFELFQAPLSVYTRTSRIRSARVPEYAMMSFTLLTQTILPAKQVDSLLRSSFGFLLRIRSGRSMFQGPRGNIIASLRETSGR